MRTSRLSLAALCATAPLHLSLVSQTPISVNLTGEIVDSNAAAIAGAKVDVRLQNGTRATTVTTSADGQFHLSGLPPGRYTVHVERAGFQPQTVQVSWTAGDPVRLRIALAVSTLTQSVTVTAQPLPVGEAPTGQTQSNVSREEFKHTPATNIGQVLALVPGVTFAQGNGPRDVRISIRGSNDRQSFGIRNAQTFEDGFPVTQPDGLARTDLTDPHAYSSVDVVQGPSSALYGNYATGGAIDFHTRTGDDIHGLEVGADFGSFQYFNDYATYGTGNAHYQVAAFLSNVRAAQATANNQFNTVTANLLASFAPTVDDRFTFKFIDNDLDTNLSLRLSLAQYRMNPYQAGCDSYTANAAAGGCASIGVFTNGYNGARQSLTAGQAGLGRHDRRTIAGARWEHDLTDQTIWRTQFVFDNRDANQPTGATTYRGTLPSFNVMSDGTRRGSLFGRKAVTFAGGFFNYETITSTSSNLTAAGNATVGGAVQTVAGSHLNTGGRTRQEIALTDRWTLVGGIGFEYTALSALANNLTYPTGAAPVSTPVNGDRTFFNVAPEVALQYHPVDALRLHARLGTGYGTPQATQLFTTPQGTFGNNTTLKTQKNLGVEVGAEWLLSSHLQATITAFYEWFHNEQVTQSPGVNLQSYTFNAPASAHRGIEAGFDWHPAPQGLRGLRLRAAYLYDNQVYTAYTEQITTGAATATFDRSGNRIPGVQPNFLNSRVLYDQASGALRGFGAFLEANWRDTYRLDNANLLTAPGYTLLNLSTYYDTPTGHGALSRLRFYFDIQNLANKIYVASANNITNSLAANGQQNGAAVLATATGSVYAGTPRASYGGVRVRF